MTKETEPDRPGKQLLQESKNKAKKEIKMKNLKNNSTFKTVTHVILTLVTLAVIGAIYFAGFTQGEKHQQGQEAYIQSIVQAKVLSATTESSKANLQSK